MRGFTLLEVLVVIAIMSIVTSITASTMENLQQSVALKSGTDEIYRALTDARNRTLASEGGTVYGVKMSTSSVTRFVGSTYSAGAAGNEVFVFERGITATSSLINSGIPIVFERLTGESSATGTIFVRNNSGSATSTMILYASGMVEY
jgi:prepilin-type N-terminal cleavage/methylation domain-containing protein